MSFIQIIRIFGWALAVLGVLSFALSIKYEDIKGMLGGLTMVAIGTVLIEA